MDVNFPKRSAEGAARHAKKKHVRRHGDHSIAAQSKTKRRRRNDENGSNGAN